MKRLLPFICAICIFASAFLFACSPAQPTSEQPIPSNPDTNTFLPPDPPEQELTYTLNDDQISYTVSGIGNYTDTSVIIPEQYNGLPVTAIGAAAFFSSSTLTKVTLPSTVTEIGADAFGSCPVLTPSATYGGAYYLGTSENPYYVLWKAANPQITTCEIHPNTSIIAADAFKNCTAITEIQIPQGVISIGGATAYDESGGAFAGCTALQSISIPDSVINIGSGAFSGCESLLPSTESDGILYLGNTNNPYHLLWKVRNTSAKTYGIHPQTKILYSGAFQNTSVQNITLPTGVLQIGAACFGASALREITLPDTLLCIGERAFSGCESLIRVVIPSSVKNLGKYLFSGCIALEEAVFSEGVTYLPNGATTETGTADGIFYHCTALRSLTLFDGMTRIGAYAFFDCPSLASLTLPNSVTSIGDAAFDACYSLSEITFGSALKSIGNVVFKNCTALTQVIIPSGVTSIGYGAFSGCTSLSSTTLPQSLLSVGKGAFDGCIALVPSAVYGNAKYLGNEENPFCVLYQVTDADITNCTVHPSLHIIADSAFSGCTALTEIDIPDGVVRIGSRTFQGCTALQRISIPDSVQTLGNMTFYDCSSLRQIIVPEAVTSIGDSLFYRCNALSEVIIKGKIESIGSYAFHECTSLAAITLPNTLKTIHYRAFSGCTALSYIIIPQSVISIGYYAFEGWSSSQTIFCECTEKPQGWFFGWDGNASANICWSSMWSYNGKEPVQK